MKKTMQHIPELLSRKRLHLFAAACLAVTMLLSHAQAVSMQSSAEDDWTPPINLSNSGSTSAPIVLTDSLNFTHVIWYDSFAGYRHTQAGEDGMWSEPGVLILPFEEIQPAIISGPNNFLYAFWLDEGELLYSRVIDTNVGSSTAWEVALPLGIDVLGYDVSIDADQTIHLAYLKQSDEGELAAGVYYRQKPAGMAWTIDQPVITSPYFRTMAAEQAFVSVAGGGITREVDGADVEEKNIYVAWDEPHGLRSLVSNSTDGGTIWGEPVEIDNDRGATGSNMPFAPELTVWNNQTVLIWQKKLSPTTCEMRYKVDVDGQTWSTADTVFESFSGCPDRTSFLVQRDDLVLWQADIGNQVFLAAWNGTEWSEPRTEPLLTGFWDEDTGKTMTIANRYLFYQDDEDSLLAVGCDVNASQDVWFTRKTLENLEDWFLTFSSWQMSTEITVAREEFSDIAITSDGMGNFHALWLQSSTTPTGSQSIAGDTPKVIHYTRWDGEAWTESTVVVGGADTNPLQLSAAANDAGDLLVLWRSDPGCRLLFSRVPAARAYIRLEWREPVILLTPDGLCSSPSLTAGVEQEIFVAYAVPVNERRGIYLNRSVDGGRTWEVPVQVFDAQAAGWMMADNPVLIADGNRLHLSWRQVSPLEPGTGIGLGYAYSDDGGETWQGVDTRVEEKMYWAGLATGAQGLVVRAWQWGNDEQTIITTQVSLDGGESWQPAVPVAYNGKLLGQPDLFADPFGGIHLMQMVEDYLGKAAMEHWVWAGDNWKAGESLTLGYHLGDNLLDLSGAISPQSQLAVIYAGVEREDGAQSLMAAFGQNETMQDPLVESLSEQDVTIEETEVLSATEEAPPMLLDMAAFTPAPTVTFSKSVERTNEFSTWMGLIVGAVVGSVVVAIIFLRRILRGKE
jgi:hypothetical protein